MFFLLGIIGLIQVVFLPGYIFHRYMGRPSSLIDVIPEAFGLSLVLNYLLVIILTVLRIYTRSTLFIILLIEAALFCLSLRKKHVEISSSNYSFTVAGYTPFGLAQILFIIEQAFVILVILFFCYFSLSNIGEVFTSTDAVISWNKWAVEWLKNSFPHGTYNYPQLLPVIWSVIYSIMGTSFVQFFTVAACLLFLPISLLSVYNFYLTGSRIQGLLTISIYMLYIRFLSSFPIGFADIPVTALIILSLNSLVIIMSTREDQYTVCRHLFLGSIFAAAAAITKQSGLYWCIVYFIAVAYIINSETINFEKKIYNKILIKLVLLASAIVIPWYAYARYMIYTGQNSSEISWVMEGIYHGQGYFQRIAHAFSNNRNIVLALLASVPALFFRRIFIISFSGILYVFLWAALLSYDIRNYLPSVPLLTTSTAYWLSVVFSPLRLKKKTFPSRPTQLITSKAFLAHKNIYILLLVIAVIVFGSLNYTDSYLIEMQTKKQLAIGNENVNKMVLSSLNNLGDDLILSNYQFLPYLPGFNRTNYRYCALGYLQDPENKEVCRKEFSKNHIKYILIESINIPALFSFLEAHKFVTKYREINRSGDYVLLNFQKND